MLIFVVSPTTKKEERKYNIEPDIDLYCAMDETFGIIIVEELPLYYAVVYITHKSTKINKFSLILSYC